MLFMKWGNWLRLGMAAQSLKGLNRWHFFAVVQTGSQDGLERPAVANNSPVGILA